MAEPTRFDPSLRARVVDNLHALERHVVPLAELRAAAVTLTLVPNDSGEACFLLTRRSSKLVHHRGQFALPGGRLDAGESQVEAALRELYEELGVLLPDHAVLGMLDDFKTRSGYVITPVVVWGEGVRELSPNPAEVARVYRVPLLDLYHPDSPRLLPEWQRRVAHPVATAGGYRGVQSHGRHHLPAARGGPRGARHARPSLRSAAFAWK